MECDKCVCRNGEIREGVIKGVFKACGDKRRKMVIGGMNTIVGDHKVEGVVGKFGKSGMNENGIKLIGKAREEK